METPIAFEYAMERPVHLWVRRLGGLPQHWLNTETKTRALHHAKRDGATR